jgi:hypothetical protein
MNIMDTHLAICHLGVQDHQTKKKRLNKEQPADIKKSMQG